MKLIPDYKSVVNQISLLDEKVKRVGLVSDGKNY
jgi:hypothetical protein